MMKLKPFASILAAIALAGGTIATRPEPSAAQGNTYICEQSADGVFTTFAETPNGDRIPVIRWEREWGGEYTRESRCLEVSWRLRKAEKEGVLNYITSGEMNGYNIICTAKHYGGPCRNLLLTIRHSDDPEETMDELIGVGSKSASPLSQCDGCPPRYYYDMELLLQLKAPE